MVEGISASEMAGDKRHRSRGRGETLTMDVKGNNKKIRHEHSPKDSEIIGVVFYKLGRQLPGTGGET